MTRKSVGPNGSTRLGGWPVAGLKDAYHRPREPRVTEEACAW